MAKTVPAVERPDHADTLHARRPYREQATGYAVDEFVPRAEKPVGMVVPPFREEVQVILVQAGAEAVGIDDLVPRSAQGFPPPETIVLTDALGVIGIQKGLVDVVSVDTAHRSEFLQLDLHGRPHVAVLLVLVEDRLPRKGHHLAVLEHLYFSKK